MSSSYTTRLRLEKQGSGENASTWGDKLNDSVIDLQPMVFLTKPVVPYFIFMALVQLQYL